MKGHKNIRLKNYDYSSNGYYFVTLCADNRKPLFKNSLVNRVIENELNRLEEIDGAEIDYSVIMPDHLHVIIVLNDCEIKLGEIIRRFKARASKVAEKKLWQPNYYEHAIRNDRALYKIREYIENNPLVAEIEFEQFYEKEEM